MEDFENMNREKKPEKKSTRIQFLWRLLTKKD